MVALTKTGQYIVTPDNGTLSYIKKDVGIVAVREISEVENRRSNTELSYTFHGRDVYAYTGAKLASGHISFEAVSYTHLDVYKRQELNYTNEILHKC